MSKKIILFTLMAVLVAGLSYAQMGQVGSIRGTVTIENEGAPLPGVNITLRSPAMILPSMSAMTNDKGNYRFLNLSPGVYELTFEISGFGTIIRKDIIVSANMTFTVDIAMSPEKVEEAITVMGQAPTIDRQSTAKTTTLDKTFLASVPAGRDLNYFLNMTPGVTGNSAQGATVRDNLYSVDGIQINDPSVGTITGNPLSIEIMEELSVQAGGASAEWGSAKGGIMNVVTKSGGNNFSGAIQFLYENENLKSDNTQGTPFAGQKSGNKFWMEPSFSLGGPIVKDKVWFFTNFTYRGFETFAPGFPFNGDPIPLKETGYIPYIKFTFQPSPSDKFVLGTSYQKTKRLPDWGDQNYTIDSVRNVLRVITVPSFHWIHTWGPKFVTNFKIGLLSYKWDFTPTANGNKTQDYDYYSYRVYSGCGFEDLYQRTRFQVNADGTLFVDDLAGSHEIKFGVQNSMHYTRRTVHVFGEKNSQGFAKAWNYLWDGEIYMVEYDAGFNQIAKSLNSGLFFNDAWNVSKRLTLNIGLRLDYNWNYTPVQDGSVGDIASAGDLGFVGDPGSTWDLNIKKNVSYFKWLTLSPRLGMVFDITGDGKTLLKTNFSQYLQDNYTAMTWFVSPVGWVGYYGGATPDGTMYELWGSWVPGSTMKMGYAGHDLVAPRTYELSVGLERELMEDVSISGRFVRRWDRKLIEDADGSSIDMDALMNSGEVVFDSTRWTAYSYVDPYDGKTVTFFKDQYQTPELYLVNPPLLKRDYTAFEFTLRKRFSRGWSFDLSYVYSKAEGLVQNTYWESELDEPLFNNPNAHVNALGKMALDRPHMLKLSGVVKGPLGINISGYLRFLSGYAERRRVTSKNAGFTFDNTTINAEPYGAYHLPDQFLVDFRLEKEFRVGDSLTLKAFCDVFNVTNSNKATEMRTISNTTNPTQQFGTPTAILSSRAFRIGAKIEFNL